MTSQKRIQIRNYLSVLIFSVVMVFSGSSALAQQDTIAPDLIPSDSLPPAQQDTIAGMTNSLTTAKLDTILTNTGNLIDGEFISMKLGVLTFDTDYADSKFKIEWDKVNQITTNRLMLIFTKNGARLVGRLKSIPGEMKVAELIIFNNSIHLSLDEIVEIRVVEDKFMDRMYIWLDAGFTYTKANKSQQVSVDAQVRYQTERWWLAADMNKVGTYQENAARSSRTSGSSTFAYSLKGDLFGYAGLEFLRNSQQMLDIRATSKLGLGYYLFRTTSWYLGVGAGMAESLEKYGGDEPLTTNNLEGLVGLDLNIYDLGDLDFSGKVTLYPRLTVKGVRMNSDLSIKYDLPLEFYIKLSYTSNFDSAPAVNVSKSDFVVQTSIGWEWD